MLSKLVGAVPRSWRLRIPAPVRGPCPRSPLAWPPRPAPWPLRRCARPRLRLRLGRGCVRRLQRRLPLLAPLFPLRQSPRISSGVHPWIAWVCRRRAQLCWRRAGRRRMRRRRRCVRGCASSSPRASPPSSSACVPSSRVSAVSWQPSWQPSSLSVRPSALVHPRRRRLSRLFPVQSGIWTWTARRTGSRGADPQPSARCLMMKKNRADLAGDRLGIPLSWSHLATGSCSSEPPDPCSGSYSCSGSGSCRSCPSRPTSPRLRL